MQRGPEGAGTEGEGAACAGEYNLRLGIMKEVRPDMVATHQGARLALPPCAACCPAAQLCYPQRLLGTAICPCELGRRAGGRGQPRAGAPGVLEGHAFVVEAAVSLGGRDLKPGLNIYRFANRIPLLFEVAPWPVHVQHVGTARPSAALGCRLASSRLARPWQLIRGCPGFSRQARKNCVGAAQGVSPPQV